MTNSIFKVLILALFVAGIVLSAPAPTKPPKEEPEVVEPLDPDPDKESPNTGLYYDQYLQKIVKLLESDESFKKTMENANFDDIKNGKLSEEIYKIPSDIRKQLDGAKKEEITRLRKILHAKLELEKGRKVSQSGYLKQIANHLDSSNPHTFESQDLTNLIKAATKDLENFDEKRHEDFKKYEMTKELRRQEKLKQMNEADKQKAEKEYQEMRKKHEDHPDMNHPGSEAQLDEIWKESDGLTDEKFDPKTFFMMHDLNGDNRLDPMELEALFEKDLAKVYDSNNPEDDMIEMEAERTRMRQHVMKEVDRDSDGLITIDEFMRYTNTEEFGTPDKESYKSVDQMIDEEELYSKEEMEEFRAMIEEQEKDVKEKLDALRKQAQAVVSLKSDMYVHESKMGTNPPEHVKAELQEKKDKVEEEEQVLKEMHEDLKEQSQEVLEMKQELNKQETAVKVREGQPAHVLNSETGHAVLEEEPALNMGKVDPVMHMDKDPEHHQ